uniref:ABC transmembrane type-1 domain-containing protein n=1 Tax=Angiostrongylus cantonensis TaxID=6313 RepID=A0A0K0DPP7_ANGCA
MAFSDQQRVTAVVPGISRSADAATGLVRRLIMEATTNVIMANWSRQMWQGVLDRVARRLSSGPFATNFFGVFVTIT